MRRFSRLASGVLALTIAACSEAPQSTGPTTIPLTVIKAPANSVVPGRYIVLFKPGVRSAAAEADRIVRRDGGQVRFTYEHAVRGFAADLPDAAVERLRTDPTVALIEEDGLMYADGTQAPTPSWGLDRIDQQNLPLNNSFTYNRTGAGVHFYGIDTGILGGIGGNATAPHVEFVGRLSTGFDAITAGGQANDCDGHGSHTASTAAGTTYGVAKQATIHPVRVLDCTGSGSYSQVIAGINWVTQDHQAHPGQRSVANMSLGGPLDPATNNAVAASIAAGVVYAVSAGNSYGADACTQSPAATPTALTVASSESNDARSSFTNIGPCVDLYAPGGSIRGAYIGSTTASAVLSGTSMASPHVAGVAMLYLEANPTATPAQVGSAITGNATPNKIPSPGANTPNRLLYAGFIPPPGGGGGNQAPVARFTWTCITGKVRQCAFDASTSSDDVGITSYSYNFGDGTVGILGVTKHTYAVAGSYVVTLTVTDAGGLSSTMTQTVTTGTAPGGNQAPVARFTSSCTGGSCSFNGSTSSDDVGITSYAWAYGDGGTGSGVTSNHTYAASGAYQVTLTVTDGGGLTNSTTQTVNVTLPVNQPPVASYTFSCTSGNCSFDGTGSSDDVGVTSYAWTFGDGGTGSGATPSHTYLATGSYQVTLTVTDGGGLSNSITKTVAVTVPSGNQPPVANFTVNCNTGKARQCAFDGSSSTDDVGVVSYSWNFGDGILGSVNPTKHTYATSGSKTVTLTVTDGGGLTSSKTVTITVP